MHFSCARRMSEMDFTSNRESIKSQNRTSHFEKLAKRLSLSNLILYSTRLPIRLVEQYDYMFSMKDYNTYVFLEYITLKDTLVSKVDSNNCDTRFSTSSPLRCTEKKVMLMATKI